MDLGSAHGRIEFLYDGGGVQRAVGDLQKLEGAGNNLTRNMAAVGGAMLGVGGAISGIVGVATGFAANFEQQMDNVAASLGLVEGESEAVDTTLAALSDTALRIGADTAFSAQEAAVAMEELAKIGVSAEDIIGGVADATVNLAAAIGAPLDASGQAIGAVMNTFEMEASQASDIADTLTASINASSVELDDFNMGFRNLAPTMSQFVSDTYSAEEAFVDTSAAIAYFSNFGLKAADVGLSVGRGISEMAAQTGPAYEEMTRLGISAFDLSTGAFVGLPTIMDQLANAMGDMTDQEKITSLGLIFGAESADVYAQAIARGGDGLREMTAEVVANGQAAEQAAIRQDNFKGAMEQLMGTIQSLAIAFGTPLLDGMRSTTEGIQSILEAFLEIDPAVQAVISRIVALTGTLLGVGGSALIAASYFVRIAQALGLTQTAALRLVAVFGVLGFALAALGIAYATNFLGFGDKVREIMGETADNLSQFMDEFHNLSLLFRGMGFNKLAAGVKAFGKALYDAFGIDIEQQTDTIADAIQAVDDAFWSASEAGSNFIASALMGLSAGAAVFGLTDLSDTLESLALKSQFFGEEFDILSDKIYDSGERYSRTAANVDAFGQALNEAFGIDITGFTNRAADAIDAFSIAAGQAADQGAGPLEQAVAGLRAAFEELTGIDTSGFFDAIGNLGGTIRDIGSAIRDADFDQVGSVLRGALDELGAFAQSGIQNALTSIGDAIGSIDLGAIAVNVGSWLQGRWEDLKTWLETNVKPQIPNIDLGEIAATVSSWIVSGIEGLATAIQELVSGKSETSQGGPGGSGGAAGGAPIDLGEIKASIGSWFIEQKENLVTAIETKVNEFKAGLQSIPLDEIKANITGWIIGVGQGVGTLLSEIQKYADAAIGGMADFIVDIPQVTANIIGWFITAGQDLTEAIQSWLGGGTETSQGAPGGSGGSAGGLAVEVNSVIANIASWVEGTGIADLAGDIQEWIGDISIPGINVTIESIFIDAASAIAAAVGEFRATLESAIQKGVTETSQGGPGGSGGAAGMDLEVSPRIGTLTINAPEDPPNIVDNFGTWVDEQITKITTLSTVDLATMLDLGNEAGNLVVDFANAIAVGIQEGARILSELDIGDEWKDPGEHLRAIGRLAKPAAAAVAAITALGTGFVLALEGVQDIDAQDVRDTFSDLGAAFEEGMQEFTEVFSGEGLQQNVPGPGANRPGDFVDTMDTDLGFWATEIENIITRYEQSFEDLVEGVRGAIEGFKTKWQDLWSFMSASSLTESSQGGPGGSGGSAEMGQSPMGQFVEDFIGQIGDLPNLLEGALADLGDPFEPIVSWFEEKREGLFELLFPSASAAGDKGELDTQGLGEQMGADIADAFASEEFIAGLDAGLKSLPANTFQDIGESLMTNIQDGVIAAMSSETFTKESTENVEGVSQTVGSGMAATLAQTMVNQLTAGLAEVRPETFQAAGQTMMARIQQGLSAAMLNLDAEGAAQEGAPGGSAAGIVQTLASNIALGIVQAPLESFQAIGTAINTKLAEVMSTAMQGGGQTVAGPGGGAGQGAQQGAGFGQQIVDMIAQGVSGASFEAVGQALQTGLTTAITTAMTAISTVISTTTNQWIITFSTTFGALTSTVTTGMASVTAAITQAMAQASLAVFNAGSQIVAEFQRIVTSATTAGTDAGNGFATGISGGMANAQADVVGAVATIESTLRSAAATAYSSGVAVGQGFADGIRSMVGEVSAAAGELAGAAIGGIAGAIIEGSPSKVTTEQGENTGLGFVEGLRNLIDEVIAAGTELGQAGVQSLIDGIKSLHEQLYNEITSMVNTVESGMQEADAAIGSSTDAMAEQAGQTGEQIGTAATDGMEKSISADAGTEIVKDAGTSTGEALGTGVTEGMEDTTSGLCDTMATQATDAAGCATDAINSAAGGLTDTATQTLGTEAGAATGQEFGNSFGQEMTSSMLGQMELGGDGIGGQAIQSILGQLNGSVADVAEGGRRVGSELGTAVQTGMTESLKFDPQQMGIPAAGQDFANSLIESMQQRLNQQLSDTKELIAERNNYAAQLMERERPLHIEIVSQLDGKELDRRIVETTFGGIDEALSRNPSNRRRN